MEHDALVRRWHGAVLEGEHILALRNVRSFLLEGVGLEASGISMSSVDFDEGLHRFITRQLLEMLLDVVDELVDRCQLICPLAEEASNPLFKFATFVGALSVGVSALNETVNHAEESIVSLSPNVLRTIANHLLDVSSDTLVVRGFVGKGLGCSKSLDENLMQAEEEVETLSANDKSITGRSKLLAI